jgi:hypothetical protein
VTLTQPSAAASALIRPSCHRGAASSSLCVPCSRFVPTMRARDERPYTLAWSHRSSSRWTRLQPEGRRGDRRTARSSASPRIRASARATSSPTASSRKRRPRRVATGVSGHCRQLQGAARRRRRRPRLATSKRGPSATASPRAGTSSPVCREAIHGGVAGIKRVVFPIDELERTDADIIVAGHCGMLFKERKKEREKVGQHLWFNPGAIGWPANDGTLPAAGSAMESARAQILCCNTHAARTD